MCVCVCLCTSERARENIICVGEEMKSNLHHSVCVGGRATLIHNIVQSAGGSYTKTNELGKILEKTKGLKNGGEG